MKRIPIHNLNASFRKHDLAYGVVLRQVITILTTGVDVNNTAASMFFTKLPNLRSSQGISYCHTFFKFLIPLKGEDFVTGADVETILKIIARWESNKPSLLVADSNLFEDCLTLLVRLFDYDKFKAGKYPVLYKRRVKDVNGNSSYAIKWSDSDDWSAKEYLTALMNTSGVELRCCPYCNSDLLYAFGFRRNKIEFARSALDHFYPKSLYPFLAISLCNLVPSCYRCNTTFKGAVNPMSSGIAHPYYNDFDSEVAFTWGDVRKKAIDGTLKREDVKVMVKPLNSNNVSSSMRSIDHFKIKELYQHLHLEEISQIPDRLNELKSMFEEDTLRQLRVPVAQTLVYNHRKSLIFNCSFDKAKINARPLSKLKQDLVAELEHI